MVRPFRPSSARKPAYAGERAFAPEPTGGTGALGAAAGTEGNRATAGGEAAGSGLGRLGPGSEAGFGGGAAASGFAGPAAHCFAGAAADCFAGGRADAGFAGAATAGAFCQDFEVDAAAGLRNPAGMGRGGGATLPTRIPPNVGLLINFPVVGHVRISGECCFSQWGQGFTTGLDEGGAIIPPPTPPLMKSGPGLFFSGLLASGRPQSLPLARGRGILWPMSDSQEAAARPSGAVLASEAAARPAPEVVERDVAAARELCEAQRTLCAEIGKRIIGQHEVIDHLLIALFSRGHCLFVGVPGLAKTMLIQTLADVLDLSFGRIQFTPDLMPSDITGSDVLEEDRTTGRRVFRFVRGPIFANVILADEINRTPPKTQAALLQSMQEYRVSAGGTTYNLPLPFLVFATQNPIEQEGTYPLPEAQLDRFMFEVDVGYPNAEEEVRIASQSAGSHRPALRKVLSPQRILDLQDLVLRVPVADHVLRHAVALCRATRPGPGSPEPIGQYVAWGAGPRASQHLVLAAKARAVLDGRYAVSIEDVRRMALPVFIHRLVRNFHAEADGVSSRALIERLLQTVQPE
jgi:MoxR-like ATPase